MKNKDEMPDVLIIWWLFFVIFTPLAIDYFEGVWTGLGLINDK